MGPQSKSTVGATQIQEWKMVLKTLSVLHQISRVPGCERSKRTSVKFSLGSACSDRQSCGWGAVGWGGVGWGGVGWGGVGLGGVGVGVGVGGVGWGGAVAKPTGRCWAFSRCGDANGSLFS